MKPVNHFFTRTALAAVIAAAALAGFAATPASASNVDSAGANTISPDVRAMMARADDATRRGDLRVAVLLLKNAAQAAPRQASIRAQLGTVLVMQGGMPEAERTLREARRMGAPDAAVLAPLFQAMLAQQEYQAVLDQFAEPGANDRSQTAADTFRARALAYFSLKNTSAADAEIDRALAIRRSAAFLINKAEFALARGDRALALTITDEALKAAPKDSAALTMKIGLLERAGSNQDAVGFANRLVQAAPRDAMPRILRIELLAKLRQDAGAEADVNWLLANNPTMPIALYYRALLEAKKGDIKDAWQIAQALPPEFLHTAPQFGLGAAQIAGASGNHDIEEAMLTTVIANYPGNEEARLSLAAKRLAEKNVKSAIALLDPVKTSTNPQVMALLGQAYQASGDSAAASTYLAKAVALANGASGNQTQAANVAQWIGRLQGLSKQSPGNADIAGTLIVALIQSGRAGDAQAVADRFDKASRNNPMTPLLRGQIAMATGDLDGAAQDFSTVLRANPGYAPALYYRAQVAASRGDLTAANTDLDSVLRANPKDTQALSKKAQYAMQAGRDDQAVSFLQNAISATPKDPAPQLALADFYLARRNFAKAENVNAALLRQMPDNAPAQAAEIRIQLGQNDAKKAVDMARQLAGNYPNSAAANMLLGDALDLARDRAGAAAAYESAIRAEPANPAPYRSLIQHYARSNESAKIVDVARQFAARQPGTDSDLMLADTLLLAGKTADAKALLTRSAAQRPDSRLVLALSAIESRTDRKAAEARLTKWAAAHDGDLAAISQLANMQMADGDMKAAEAGFTKLVRLQPYNPSFLNDLAWAIQKSDPARALRTAGLAAKIAPQSGEILDTLAWLKWQQNDRGNSVEMLRQAHALNPAEPNIAYHLAVVLDASGNRGEARRTLQAALKSNAVFSNGDQAKQLMAQWK